MTKGSSVQGSVELLVVGMSRLEKNVESLAESVEFIIGNMVTRGEFEAGMAELRDEISTSEQRIEQKIGGISNRMDYELDKRKQLEVRVDRLEQKIQ